LDRLAVFRSSTFVGSVSSYDRSGGNDDGFSGKYSYIRKDPEGLVLADLKGPGAIYRIWTPTPTDDLIEFLFDRETAPRLRLKFRELFLGEHPAFPRPLVGFGAGGYYSYLPLPFEKSCVVRIRASKMQFYQINYAQYAPETPVTTFTLDSRPETTAARQKACQIWSRPGQDLTPFTTPPGENVRLVRKAVNLVPHSVATLFEAERGGRIVGLRLWPASALAGKARDLLLKISYDGEAPTAIGPCRLIAVRGSKWFRNVKAQSSSTPRWFGRLCLVPPTKEGSTLSGDARTRPHRASPIRSSKLRDAGIWLALFSRLRDLSRGKLSSSKGMTRR
jgi:hypothetical protein